MKSKLNTIIPILIIIICSVAALYLQQQRSQKVSEKIIFSPPEFLEATEGVSYSYSFCKPDSARSGATCGGLAGATTNPTGGNPPYSFTHQFGSGFLPPGLALELNGLLRGTPTLAGNYTFGICANDGQNEACGTTTLTVKPKSEQLEEQISPSVKIESATATLKEDGKQFLCTVEMSGTVTGPECAHLWVAWGAYREPGIIMYPVTCPNWTYWGTSGICVRDSGKPAATKWSITSDQYFGKGMGTEFFAVLDTPKLPLENLSVGNRCAIAELGNRTWDSVTLTCD